MKKKASHCAALAMSMALASGLMAAHAAPQAPGTTGGKSQAARSQRGQLVYDIVLKWGRHVQEVYGISPGAWANEMGALFAKVGMKDLERAAAARNFETMNDALMGKAPVISPQSLGDPATDLTYVPVVPCRLFDTRLAGGAIAVNTTRGFDVTAVSDYSFQGGAASNCGGVGAAGSFAAAVINLTVVSPAGQGFITAFPFGATRPLAATMVYRAGDLFSNSAIVPLDQGASANEVSIFASNTTHLVGDIVGYFINPAATALQCTEVDGTPLNLAAGAAGNAFAGACPATYTAVEVQCRPSIFGMRVAGSWSGHCNVVNDSASAGTVTATARCCRVPGR